MATAIRLVEQNQIEFRTQKLAPLKRRFVFNEDDDSRKFRTIKEDDPFFRLEILGFDRNVIAPNSAAAKRMRSASNYFESEVPQDQTTYETVIV